MTREEIEQAHRESTPLVCERDYGHHRQSFLVRAVKSSHGRVVKPRKLIHGWMVHVEAIADGGPITGSGWWPLESLRVATAAELLTGKVER